MAVVLRSNADCIIYNDYNVGTSASRRVVKHILHDVWWAEKKAINVIAMGTTSANSVEVLVTKREGYKTPREWSLLTIDEVLSQRYYTLQEGDRMIRGIPIDAPNTFESTARVDDFFGTQYAHPVMSIDEKLLPGGETHHFKVGCL